MYTFKKEERLCNKRLLKKLFHNGSSFLVYPFRIVHLQEMIPLPFPVQVVIAVPKRNFKRSVDRNLIKRRIRESYRLYKDDLLYQFLREKDQKILLSIHYIGKEIPSFNLLNKKLKIALEKVKFLMANEVS